MIEYLEVENESGDILHLPLSSFEETGMAIINIDGINTVKSNVNMSSHADSDTKTLNSNILETRNITIKLRFFNTLTKSVEQVRHECYSYFTPKKTIILTIKTDLRYVNIEGVVESNDPSIFSKEEEANISILCEDPLFYDVEKNDITIDENNFNSVRAGLEFPMSNESLTEKLIVLGEIQHRPVSAISYLGEYNIGFTIRIHFKGVVIDPIIYSNRQGGSFKLITSRLTDIIPDETRFKKGDYVTINTRRGSKSIMLLRDGKVYNILHILDSSSIWPILMTGNNEFVIDAENGFELLDITYEYNIGYLGI